MVQDVRFRDFRVFGAAEGFRVAKGKSLAVSVVVYLVYAALGRKARFDAILCRCK